MPRQRGDPLAAHKLEQHVAVALFLPNEQRKRGEKTAVIGRARPILTALEQTPAFSSLAELKLLDRIGDRAPFGTGEPVFGIPWQMVNRTGLGMKIVTPNL